MCPRLSQVLLTDENWLQRIATRINYADFGVEWACGRGALTEYLLPERNFLLGMELDENFCRKLAGKFENSNLFLIQTDILKYPLPDKHTPYPLVGNLPYHLTGPLLIKILRNSPKLNSFAGLIQQEVARRIIARPGDRNYGSLSLLFDLYGRVEAVYDLPPGAFSPPPEVNSTWIEFFPAKNDLNFESARKLTRKCFRYPRKTLLNNLAENKEMKKRWRQWLQEKGIDSRIRPNKLTPELFLEVHSKWKEIL